MMIVEPIKTEGGLFVFHPEVQESSKDYPSTGLNNLFNAEEYHFWFKARKNKIYKILSKFILKDSRILDLGGGTGNIAKFLQDKGLNVSLGDIYLSGLKFAKSRGIKKLFQFDLLRSPFREEFDVVCMFDVLEHFEEDIMALNKVKEMLCKNGKLIITVPAHNWLWSRDDKIAGHKRRYTIESIKKVVSGAGFKISHCSYFFMFLIPFLFLRTLLNPDTPKTISQKEYEQGIKINPIFNKILWGLCALEEKLIPWYFRPFGGSLILVARKVN